MLQAVLRRRTALVRSSASRTSRGQLLAANVDTVVVTVSLAAPLKHARIERMLALAWESGAQPVVALTKADACADVERLAAEVAETAPGAEVLVTSVVTGQGLDALAAVLNGTIVLLGPSGAGKSSLGNHLLGEERLTTGAVREQDGKGRHTTAWRELLPLPGGGVLLDTPGLRAVGLQDAQDGLEQTFAEIEQLARECRFGDCAHAGEPGCAVLAADRDRPAHPAPAGELPAAAAGERLRRRPRRRPAAGGAESGLEGPRPASAGSLPVAGSPAVTGGLKCAPGPRRWPSDSRRPPP